MRPDVHTSWLRMAREASRRSTCLRRSVGCILVSRDNEVLGIGRNGVPSGEPHCNEQTVIHTLVGTKTVMIPALYPNACPGANAPSGTSLTQCRAVHAEINAVIRCRHPHDIVTCYTTASPCDQCVGFLLNTPCHSIVFAEVYPHPEAKERWERAGRSWVQWSYGDE